MRRPAQDGQKPLPLHENASGGVVERERLGGVLRYYYRAA